MENCIYIGCPLISAWDGSHLSLRNVSFIDAIVPNEGLAFLRVSFSLVEADSCTFRNITNGMAFYARHSYLTLRNITMQDITSPYEGSTFSYSTVLIRGFRCLDCTAASYAGCLFIDESIVDGGDMVFTGNTLVGRSPRSGGAILASYSKVLIENAVFSDNHAEFGAAASIESGSSVMFRNSIFENHNNTKNTIQVIEETASVVMVHSIARNNGGWHVIVAFEARVYISESVFSENRVDFFPIYYVSDVFGTCHLCRFIDNVALSVDFGVGALVLSDYCFVALHDTTFVGNKGVKAGAIYVVEEAFLSIVGSLTMASNTGGYMINNASVHLEAVSTDLLVFENRLDASSGSSIEAVFAFSDTNVAQLAVEAIAIEDFPSLVFSDGIPQRLLLKDVGMSSMEVSEKTAAITPLEFSLVDRFGSAAYDSWNISIAVISSTTFAVLEGETMSAAVNGVARFRNLTLNVNSSGNVILQAQFAHNFSTLTVDPSPEITVSVKLQSGQGENGGGPPIVLWSVVSVAVVGLVVAVHYSIRHRTRKSKFFALKATSASAHASTEPKALSSVNTSAALSALNKSMAMSSTSKTSTAVLTDVSRHSGHGHYSIRANATTIAPSTSILLSIPGFAKLQYSDFAISDPKRIGSGGSASVYRGTLSKDLAAKHGFTDVAIKVFESNFSVQAVRFELAIMSELRQKSEHIIELVGYTDDPELVVLTRLYPNGSLSGLIHDQSKSYDKALITMMAHGIAKGMEVIHSLRIVHYDLKPANLLLGENNMPVISDFGVANLVGNDVSANERLVAGLANPADQGHKGFTPGEVISHTICLNLHDSSVCFSGTLSTIQYYIRDRQKV